jgi:dTDP-4-dehydrorhamnose 3,5-epimerase
MVFTATRLSGVVIVDCDVFADARGLFARAWMPDEFRANGLDTRIAQCSLSFNRKRGTIRGMHYQVAPFEEIKLVRTTRGAVFDVAVDLRRDSPTFRQWVGVELSADNRRMLYIPEGFAHGYQTLTDDAELLYFVSTEYSAEHQRGVRWDDPAFGVDWPLGQPTVIHDRDKRYADFRSSSPES